jgi:hypothetical protein
VRPEWCETHEKSVSGCFIRIMGGCDPVSRRSTCLASVSREARFAARPALIRPTTHQDRGRSHFFSEEIRFGKIYSFKLKYFLRGTAFARRKNLTPSRLRPISPFRYVGQGGQDAKVKTKPEIAGKERPERKAENGKLSPQRHKEHEEEDFKLVSFLPIFSVFVSLRASR